MQRVVENDIGAVVKALEHLTNTLIKLTLTEKVDICAHARAIEKAAKVIDDAIKAEIKLKLKGRDGTVNGELFRAVRVSGPVTRLNQQKLEVEHPRIYASCLNTTNETKTLFQLR